MNFIYALVFLSLNAKAKAQVQNIEIQWSLCETDAALVLSKVEFEAKKNKDRRLSYFDDHQLQLFKQGIQLRLRGPEQSLRSTVKVHYENENQVPWSWLEGKDFKCEYDQVADKKTLACSLNSDVAESSHWLSSQQFKYLQKENINLEHLSLKQFGPLLDEEWTFKKFIVDGEISLEQIKLSPQHVLLSLSVRVPIEKSEEVQSLVSTYLKNKKIQICAQQISKTESILLELNKP